MVVPSIWNFDLMNEISRDLVRIDTFFHFLGGRGTTCPPPQAPYNKKPIRLVGLTLQRVGGENYKRGWGGAHSAPSM